MKKYILPIICSTFLTPNIFGQQEPNYDESRVPSFELPPLLIDEQGNQVTSEEDWQSRRQELLQLMTNHMYGYFPDSGIDVEFILTGDQLIQNDQVRRKQVTLQASNGQEQVDMHLLVYLPANMKQAVPVFLGLNFYGNHTIHSDEGIIIPRSWSRNNEEFGISNNRPSAASRGVRASRWPVEMILSEGFGLATMYYGDIDPDFDDGFENGVHRLIFNRDLHQEQLSSISAWSWGLSQALDFFHQDPTINHEQIVVIGHSRLGKTSLWAGATDERFAIVISNDSGCGGAALSRREFGETVNRINHSFPHWFNEPFNKYNQNVNQLPFDQHSLLALIAPRPLYIASASEDLWADPKGEFLSAREASVVYALMGRSGLAGLAMPEIDQPLVENHVAYHVRSGKHDITSFDWQQYLSFAKRHFQEN